MTTPPPPAPARTGKKLWIWITLIVGVVAITSIVFFAKAVIDSGITAGPDAMFGDQHLKTSVALIELHKTRTGKYPDSLKELKYLGSWDQIALQSVLYIPSRNNESYFVEVQRGWIGKPKLKLPADFWEGTGYNESLNPKPNKSLGET